MAKSLSEIHTHWIVEAYTIYEEELYKHRKPYCKEWKQAERNMRKDIKAGYFKERVGKRLGYCKHLSNGVGRTLGKYGMWGFMGFIFAYSENPQKAVMENERLRKECEDKLFKLAEKRGIVVPALSKVNYEEAEEWEAKATQPPFTPPLKSGGFSGRY